MMQNPPFQLTTKILNLVTEIQGMIGELKSISMVKPSVKLRKSNKIKTVHHSLAIEGNLLSEEQITALLEKKRVLGPKNQILEVQNALRLYESLQELNPLSEKKILKSHHILMDGLIPSSGKYRSTAIGILKGSKVSHMAPPAKQVPHLMNTLFQFLQKNEELSWLIKACVFHYEFEFTHSKMAMVAWVAFGSNSF